MKRLLSILLAAAMLFGMTGLYASAAEAPEAEPPVIVETEPAKGSGADASLRAMDAGSTNARITVSVSKVNLKIGGKQTVLITTNLAPGTYDHISSTAAKDSCFTCSWAGWKDNYSVNATIRANKVGSNNLTFTLEGAKTNGEKVLASVTIKVTVTDDSTAAVAQIWPSEPSVKLAVNEEHTIVIFENGNNSSRYRYKSSDESCVTASWGDWLDDSKQSCYLNLKGRKAGSAVITVFAEDGNGKTIGSTTINVTVTGSGSSTGTKNNTIKASNVTKKQSSKDQSFQLKASAKGGAKLSYKSSNSSVKVNSSGKVTIKKNFCGKAKITITAAAKGDYKKTTKTLTITVKPGKPKVKIKKATRNGINVSWSKVPNASGYQLKATVGKFSNTFDDGNHLADVLYSTNGNSRGKFPAKTPYKIQVRAYKVADGKRIYGPWSDVKKGKVK